MPPILGTTEVNLGQTTLDRVTYPYMYDRLLHLVESRSSSFAGQLQRWGSDAVQCQWLAGGT